jgi:hypothetical protein
VKLGSTTALTVAAAFMPAPGVFAHPGRVHEPAPVHGFSWLDPVLFFAVSVVPPVPAAVAIHRRNRRRP